MKRLLFLATACLSLVVAPLACNSRRPAVGVRALLPATPATAPTAVSADVNAREVLSYLASDELEGRGIGSTGLNRAADYIAQQFTRVGLRQVPGVGGPFQSFEMTTATAVGAKTSLRSGDRAFKLNDEFSPLGFSGEGTFHGGVAFVGY